jgi:hypothetical protein
VSDTGYINKLLALYFFGPEFNVSVANEVLVGSPNGREMYKKLLASTLKGEPHEGLQLICYKDLDTGMFVSVATLNESSPSMISFYLSSNHRYFGGQTLMCVPLQFCTNFTTIEGEYLVYRHTFKTPIMSENDIIQINETGTSEEQFEAHLANRSRAGYETIQGMSYVGMTKRSWSKRYRQHIESALENSSSTLFHKAIRDMQGEKVICVHDVSGFGLSKEDARQYEKKLIRASSLTPLGLNMKVG